MYKARNANNVIVFVKMRRVCLCVCVYVYELYDPAPRQLEKNLRLSTSFTIAFLHRFLDSLQSTHAKLISSLLFVYRVRDCPAYLYV